jgi:hypothetical protein
VLNKLGHEKLDIKLKNKASYNIAWIDFKGKKARWDLTAEIEVTGLNEYYISI